MNNKYFMSLRTHIVTSDFSWNKNEKKLQLYYAKHLPCCLNMIYRLHSQRLLTHIFNISGVFSHNVNTLWSAQFSLESKSSKSNSKINRARISLISAYARLYQLARKFQASTTVLTSSPNNSLVLQKMAA